MTTSRITRRQTLRGAAATGVAVPFLAACGDDGGTASEPAADPTQASTSATASSSPSEAASSDAAEPPVDALTTTAKVPEGGGTVFADDQVVVTQPTAGEFSCFTAICTHSGCVVSSVEGGTINCMCHGSKFSITDGSVVNGPATSGLSKVPIAVQDGSISLS